MARTTSQDFGHSRSALCSFGSPGRRTLPLFLLVSFCSISAFAQAPLQFNYQGRLTASNGVPVVGVATADFAIVRGGDIMSGGVTVHVENTLSVTTDVNGTFSHMLGVLAPIKLTNFLSGSTSRWLQVSIGGQPLLPRQQIVSVPYAMASAGDVPVGTIIMWWGDVAALPLNYKLCDGAIVSDVDSPLNGTSLPDLRGRFVKGAESGVSTLSAVGSDRGGTNQLNLSHRHVHAHTHGAGGYTAMIDFGGDAPITLSAIRRDVPVLGGTIVTPLTGGQTFSASGMNRGAVVVGTSSGANDDNTGFSLESPFDNRPTFQGVFFIIRIK